MAYSHVEISIIPHIPCQGLPRHRVIGEAEAPVCDARADSYEVLAAELDCIHITREVLVADGIDEQVIRQASGRM